MTNRTAIQAFDTYVRPIEAALACVAQPHVARTSIRVDVPRVLTIQTGMVRLRRAGHRAGLYFEFYLGYRILHDRNDRVKGPYWVETQSWIYNILDSDRRDVLTYHWTPGDRHHSEPHLHVGSIVLDSSDHELGKSFSKLHIATGAVLVQQVARMLIEEFDVQPLNSNWDDILAIPTALPA